MWDFLHLVSPRARPLLMAKACGGHWGHEAEGVGESGWDSEALPQWLAGGASGRERPKPPFQGCREVQTGDPGEADAERHMLLAALGLG